MKRWFGIRGVLILLVLVPMAPVFVSALRESFDRQASALQEARHALRRETQSRAADQRQMLEGVSRMLVAVGHTVATIADRRGECNRYLRGINEHFREYINLGFANLGGEVVCRSSSARAALNVGDRSYFKEAVASGTFTVGEYTVGRLFGRHSLVVSTPLFGPGRDLLGVLYAMIDLSSLQKSFARSPLPHGMAALLADAKGVVIASGGEGASAVGLRVSNAALQHVIVDRHPASSFEGDADQWLYASEVVSPGAGSLVVVSTMRSDALLAPLLARLRTEVGALLLIALIAAAVAWRIGDQVVASPIEHLLAKVKALQEGHAASQARGPESGRVVRELARIDEAIENLAAQLSTQTAQREAAMADLRRQTQALQASEARYRAQFEASPQPMWVFDRNTLSFLVVNDAAVTHYGYTRQEFAGMTLTDIRPPEDIPKFHDALAQGRDRPQHEVSARHRRKNGDIIHVELASHSLEWEGHDARMVIAYDVTSRLLAEQAWKRLNVTLEHQVAQRTRELELANQDLESFSYSVSHDLRAPVGVIEGFCIALQVRHGDALPQEAAHYVDRIRASAAHMKQLIQDLLALSRTGREPLERRSVDLARSAQRVVDQLRQRSPGRQVAVTIEQPLVAFCDERLMTIVLENLLGNAWKFTSRSPHAEIRVARAGLADAPGAIVVADNGAGFEGDMAGRLFKPFQRLHAATEFEGTGIGLAIVYRIVRRHGGRVWAESQPGQGARFYFSLPDEEASAAIEPSSGTAPSAQA